MGGKHLYLKSDGEALSATDLPIPAAGIPNPIAGQCYVVTDNATPEKTHLSYDNKGEVTGTTDPIGAVTHTTYGSFGEVVTSSIPRCPQSQFNKQLRRLRIERAFAIALSPCGYEQKGSRNTEIF